MTISRMLLAMIPVAIVSTIIKSNSVFVAGFLESLKFAGQLFGLEFVQADFGRELVPFLFVLGVVAGTVSMLISTILAVIAFGFAWSECGQKKNKR